MAESVGTRALTPRAPARTVEPCSSATSSSSPSRASSPLMPWARTRCSPAQERRPPPSAGPVGTASPSAPWPAAPSRRRAVWSSAPSPFPTRPNTSTPSCCPAGAAATKPSATRSSWPGSARTAPGCRRVATVCSGTFVGAAAGLLAGRRVTTHWARARELADAYPELTVDPDPIYLRDGKYWSSAGVTAGIDLALALVQDGSGRRGGPNRRPLARYVPAPSRRPDPVRLTGLGSSGRALDGPGRADPRGVGAGRRPPAPGPGGRRCHERPALHAGLHGGGRRDAEPLRRAHTPGGRPPANWRRRPTRSMSWQRACGSARPRPCGTSSSATSAWHPTPTGGASAPARTKGHPHDRQRAGRHPPLPEVHGARRRRPLRGPPAHPDPRHRLRGPRAGRGAE